MTQVLNHDIVGINARLNRSIVETHKAVSSGVTDYSEHDVQRILSYLRDVDTYHDWVIKQPQLDLPESHPRIYELPADPPVSIVENDAANDIINLLELCRTEVTNSQSARKPSGLISFDSGRLRANVDKTRKLVTDYIDKVQPLDNPESAPRSPRSGSGLPGI